MESFLRRVLALIDRYDLRAYVDWTCTDDEQIEFFVAIYGLFERTDFVREPLPEEELEALRQACVDVATLTEGDTTYAAHLYVCRRRGMRPCNTAYPTDQRLSDLFDATGPERLIETVTHTPGHRAAAELLAHPITHNLHQDDES